MNYVSQFIKTKSACLGVKITHGVVCFISLLTLIISSHFYNYIVTYICPCVVCKIAEDYDFSPHQYSSYYHWTAGIPYRNYISSFHRYWYN